MARIEIPMPQMGESIVEGTVSKWLKGVGDSVKRDEPILEISTDKVDAEIPSPQSGTLVEVHIQEGETVEVGTIVAYIDTEPGAAATGPPPVGSDEMLESDTPASSVVPKIDVSSPIPPTPSADGSGASSVSVEERLRTRSTPVVRKIAEEHGISIEDLSGTGTAGRVTKHDILSYIEDGESRSDPTPSNVIREMPGGPFSPPLATPPGAVSDVWAAFYSKVQHPEFPVREGDHVEPMDKIRGLTAEHMVLAKRIAPHVHSFIEIDFSRIDRIRTQSRAKWDEQEIRVSYTAFVAWACSRLLRGYPNVNGTVSGNNVIYRGSVNIGLAVDLDPGLIVPVIHGTDDLSLIGIGKKIIDLADRARRRKLAPSEIQGASFSITNPGVLGTLVGMPIIPKGTAAILGTGAIEKRTVVVEDPLTGTDAIAIRKRALFSLGYDHRIVDGANAARFLSDLKELLEDFPEDA
ncbi:MAG: dihydrolipoamide acetyltransferase family protein [Gemmatimonadota bacterium]|nr:dihydrolipoamide acetyltransferase family protein [Gemmatimonadota bacterium]